jgi:replication factor A2
MFNAGGGGGASQFAGGGFMPSGGEAGGEGSAQKRNYDNKTQAVRAVTVKHLADSLAAAGGELVLDGQEVQNVTLVGKVLSRAEDATLLSLVLDDGTGRVAVKQYVSPDDSELEVRARAELVEGAYVRVFGHLGHLNGEAHVVAFKAAPVADHNEVTFHLTQVVFQHMHHALDGAAGAHAGGAGAGAGAAAVGGGAAAGGAAGGLVAELLRLFNSPEVVAVQSGLTVEDAQMRLGNRYGAKAIAEGIAAAVESGELYTSIDESHWKSCSA